MVNAAASGVRVLEHRFWRGRIFSPVREYVARMESGDGSRRPVGTQHYCWRLLTSEGLDKHRWEKMKYGYYNTRSRPVYGIGEGEENLEKMQFIVSPSRRVILYKILH